jgi:hypothetical protein
MTFLLGIIFATVIVVVFVAGIFFIVISVAVTTIGFYWLILSISNILNKNNLKMIPDQKIVRKE